MRMKRYGSMLWVLGLVCVLTGGCSVRGEISRLSENGERETLGTEEMDLQQENDLEQDHEQDGLVGVGYQKHETESLVRSGSFHGYPNGQGGERQILFQRVEGRSGKPGRGIF